MQTSTFSYRSPLFLKTSVVSCKMSTFYSSHIIINERIAIIKFFVYIILKLLIKSKRKNPIHFFLWICAYILERSGTKKYLYMILYNTRHFIFCGVFASQSSWLILCKKLHFLKRLNYFKAISFILSIHNYHWREKARIMDIVGKSPQFAGYSR